VGNQFWFKPKTFGYGATPATWEGWTVMAIYGAIILACAVVMLVRKETFSAHLSSTAAIVVITVVVSTVVTVLVSVQKTDGAWGWNAGAKQNAGKND
jgi:small-conductance mechanosensitive channel